MEMRDLCTSRAFLICEALLILLLFNASSFFRTTTYTRSIASMGVLLTLTLIGWIAVASRRLLGYDGVDLGLRMRSVSGGQWLALAVLVLSLYLVAALSETLFPSEFGGDITLRRVAVTAAFSLTFGPGFEEVLFRGYLFKRIHDVSGGGSMNVGPLEVSFSSLFSGLLFGLWHLPAPILVLYFKDPLAKIYAGLTGVVIAAALMGVIMGEIRRRTGSILPGALLHFCSNSIYVITMASRLP